MLVQLDESLVVTWQFGQTDAFQRKRSASIMQHAVERQIATIVTVDMVVFLAPAELYIIEDARGNN